MKKRSIIGWLIIIGGATVTAWLLFAKAVKYFHKLYMVVNKKEES